MKRFHLTIFGLVLVLISCRENEAPITEAADLVLVGANLIDGTGAAPIADSVIVIRDGQIIASGSRETTPIPSDAQVIDFSGKSIIPGLVNMHVHYRGGSDDIKNQFNLSLIHI